MKLNWPKNLLQIQKNKNVYRQKIIITEMLLYTGQMKHTVLQTDSQGKDTSLAIDETQDNLSSRRATSNKSRGSKWEPGDQRGRVTPRCRMKNEVSCQAYVHFSIVYSIAVRSKYSL
jgi:hypothetical protein